MLPHSAIRIVVQTGRLDTLTDRLLDKTPDRAYATAYQRPAGSAVSHAVDTCAGYGARMDDALAKPRLLADLRHVRAALVGKLDGLSAYDTRRPLTPTGTTLLGLVKHCALWESRYLGDVFGRPFPEPLPPWTDHPANRDHFWARADESRDDVVGLYDRVAAHADATIAELPLDAPGHVPWWDADVTLLGVVAHRLTETARHAGHADILREQLDGAVGDDNAPPPRDAEHWRAWNARVEEAARAHR